MSGIWFVHMQSSALHLLQMPNYGNLVLNSTLLHPVSSIEFDAGWLFCLNRVSCFISRNLGIVSPAS